jgi:hypothetical protein
LNPVDQPKIAADFAAVVNMDPCEIEAWRATPESRRVGYKPARASLHAAFRTNVEDFLRKKKVAGSASGSDVHR